MWVIEKDVYCIKYSILHQIRGYLLIITAELFAIKLPKLKECATKNYESIIYSM